MQIRRVEIKNFRGIKDLTWTLNGPIACLVGPGDSGKTTILDAIELAFVPRRFVQFSDYDFHNRDVENPIVITVTVGALADELINEFECGLRLRGWKNGEFADDDEPDDQHEKVVSVQLSLDASLEPEWQLVTGRTTEPVTARARTRQRLGVFRLGEDVDQDLTWGRGSALFEVTGDPAQINRDLREVGRRASETLAQEAGAAESLADTARRVETLACELGLAECRGYCPGLDVRFLASRNSAICLHENRIPLNMAGSATRRIVAIAARQTCVTAGAIILIDEVEHALEPHRLRHLVRKLQHMTQSREIGQVILTTHSAVAIEELKATELHVVRPGNGETHVKPVPAELQAVVRGCSEALLARKVVVCEGKTECGLVKGLEERWNAVHDQPLTHRGVIWADGGGTDHAAKRAIQLGGLGYKVALLTDSDKPVPDEDLEKAQVTVMKWSGGVSTEQRIALDLPWDALKGVVELAVELNGRETVRDCIANELPGGQAVDLDGLDDLWAQVDEAELRRAVGVAAASGHGWFKSIDKGERLGEIVATALDSIQDSDLYARIGEIERWAYDG